MLQLSFTLRPLPLYKLYARWFFEHAQSHFSMVYYVPIRIPTFLTILSSTFQEGLVTIQTFFFLSANYLEDDFLEKYYVSK